MQCTVPQAARELGPSDGSAKKPATDLNSSQSPRTGRERSMDWTWADDREALLFPRPGTGDWVWIFLELGVKCYSVCL